VVMVIRLVSSTEAPMQAYLLTVVFVIAAFLQQLFKPYVDPPGRGDELNKSEYQIYMSLIFVLVAGMIMHTDSEEMDSNNTVPENVATKQWRLTAATAMVVGVIVYTILYLLYMSVVGTDRAVAPEITTVNGVFKDNNALGYDNKMPVSPTADSKVQHNDGGEAVADSKEPGKESGIRDKVGTGAKGSTGDSDLLARLRIDIRQLTLEKDAVVRQLMVMSEKAEREKVEADEKCKMLERQVEDLLAKMPRGAPNQNK
jgi:hypothetical protein